MEDLRLDPGHLEPTGTFEVPVACPNLHAVDGPLEARRLKHPLDLHLQRVFAPNEQIDVQHETEPMG